MTNSFERQLLQSICDTCNLNDIDMDRIAADDPLIGPESPLGIDSIDALEIVVMVHRNYGVRIESQQNSREVLRCLATLAAYIEKHAPEAVKLP